MKISAKKNYIYQLIYQILTIITPLITSPYLSRVLGADGIGKYSYTQNIANYFLIVSMLGVKNYGTRSIAKVQDDKIKLSKTFWSIYDCQLFLSLMMLIVYIIYLVFICDISFIVSLAQMLIILSAFFDVTWFFQGLELFKLTVTRNIVIKILTVLSIFTFVKSNSDVWIYAVIISGGTFLSQLSIAVVLKKYVSFYRPKFREIIVHFKPNLILFLPVIASSLFNSMDKIMVGRISSTTELGYYENAENITNIPNSFITSLGTVMLPRMSHLSQEGKEKESENLLNKSFLYISFMSSALTIGIISVSTVFVPWFFGNEFIPVSSLLPFLSPALIFMCWANVIRTQFLIPRGMDKEYLFSMFLGAGVNIILNAIFIQTMGARGASFATLIAEATVCITQMIIVRKQLRLKRIILQCIPFYFFGVVMYFYICNIYLINNFYSLILRIIIGALIYMVLSFIYLYITERQMFLALIKRKK